MNLIYYIKLYLLTVVIFFAVDLVWLGLVAKGFYQTQLKGILGESVHWKAAIVFYLIYIIGILIFAVIPALEKGVWSRALLWGAMFGFFTYSTYDLTNMATLDRWPLMVAVVDVLWGTVLCAAVSVLSYLCASRLLQP